MPRTVPIYPVDNTCVSRATQPAYADLYVRRRMNYLLHRVVYGCQACDLSHCTTSGSMCLAEIYFYPTPWYTYTCLSGGLPAGHGGRARGCNFVFRYILYPAGLTFIRILRQYGNFVGFFFNTNHKVDVVTARYSDGTRLPLIERGALSACCCAPCSPSRKCARPACVGVCRGRPTRGEAHACSRPARASRPRPLRSRPIKSLCLPPPHSFVC